jgi:hypothetical protein
MAIKSTPFGPVQLTGEDADAFMRQCLRGRANPKAVFNWRQGKKLVESFKRDGVVKITLNDIKFHSHEIV